MSAAEIVRNVPAETGMNRPNAENRTTKTEKETIKPKTMKSGRDEWLLTVDVPRMIGKSGKMQGPAMVTTPASNAKKNNGIIKPV